jgi:hypothetical protein
VLWNEDGAYVGDAVFAARHADLIAKDAWLIDGVDPFATLRLRLDRATHVVLVDLPLWIHFLFAARRQGPWEKGRLAHPPGGIKRPLPLAIAFRTIWEVEEQLMPLIRRYCAENGEGKKIIRLESLEDIASFTADQLMAEPEPAA